MCLAVRYNYGVAKRRVRERTLGSAVRYGLLVSVMVGVISILTLLALPGNAFHNFYRVVTQGVALSPSSDTYQIWMAEIGFQEAIIWTPLSLFLGGAAIAILAPSRATRRDVVLASAKLFLTLVVASAAFVWTVKFVREGYHIESYQIPPRLIVTQLLCFVVWTAIGALGAAFGSLLRSARTQRRAPSPT